MYAYHISTSNLLTRYEAVHKDELAMIFAEPLSIKIPPLISTNIWTSTMHNYSVEERLISEQIATYWSNFIKNDDPNDLNNDLKWLKFKQDLNPINRNIIYLNGNQSKMINFSINDMICSFFKV
jgi:carboxylesterase type B